MNTFRCVAGIAILLAATADAAAQQTQSFAGTADAYLSEAAPTTKFGAATTVLVDGDDGGKDLVSLLKWDLSSIPADSVVLSVQIQLNVTNPTTESYEIYRMTRDWDEGTATWNEAQAGSSWSMPGEHGFDARGTVTAGTTGPVTIALGASGITMVQSWVFTPSTNYGLILANSANTDGLAFSSREAATASQRPTLIVTYTANQFAGGGAAIPDDGEGFCGATGLEVMLLLGLMALIRHRIF